MILRTFPLLFIAGCSFNSLADAEVLNDSPTGFDSDSEEDIADSDPVSETPLYWSLDALWTLQSGEVLVDSSSVTIGYWSGDASLLCEQTYAIATLDVLPIPTEIPVFGWWQITLEPLEPSNDTDLDSDSETDGGSTCDVLPPQPFLFGIGTYDSQLDPALREDNVSVSSGYLYATYAKAESWDNPFVFGIAGTNANFEGDEGAITEGTLPDGVYHALDLHLLPL